MGMTTNPVIQKAIELGGGTQAELAKRAGLTQQYISLLLNGRKNLSTDAAIAISRATGGAVPIISLRPTLGDAVGQLVVPIEVSA